MSILPGKYLNPQCYHNYSRYHTVIIKHFYPLSTNFIHTTPRTIGSGILSDRYNHYHLIKPTGHNDDDDDDTGDDDGGIHHVLNTHLVPVPLLCSLYIFSFNPCIKLVSQLLLELLFITQETEAQAFRKLAKCHTDGNTIPAISLHCLHFTLKCTGPL